MSANANGDGDGDEIPGREIAYRLFAAEYDDASFSYAESDEERAPNYVISPTGARLNRLFVVGTLTEVTSVNDEMVRARVVDPTGAFVVYAGQYQPDELATLEQLDPPEFVAVTGKARTFQPEDSDQVYTSIRPESIATVDADTRDRWVVSAAEQTLERVGTYAAAADLEGDTDARTDALLEAGVETGLAAGIPLARDHYGTTPAYLAALRDCAREAVEVVAGDRDQVSGLSLQPGDSSPEFDATFDSLADLAAVDLEALEPTVESEPDATAAEPEAAVAGAGGSDAEPAADADPDESIDAGSAAGTATGTDRDAASDAVSEAADAESESGSESVGDADLEDEPTPADEIEDRGDEPETGAAAETESEADADLEDESTATFDEATDIDEPDAGDEDADDLGDFDAGDSGMYEMDDEEREQLEEEFGAEFTTGAEIEEPGEAGIDVEVADADDEPADEEPETEAAADAAADESDDTDPVEDDLGEPPTSDLEAESDEADADEDVSTVDDVEDDSAADTGDEPTDLEADADATEAQPEADDAESEPEEADAEADEGEDEAADLEDVDLEEYVVERMEELDDGSGADRSELVATVADDTGASEDEIEDAIQDALMGGQCYEPDDETLKAI